MAQACSDVGRYEQHVVQAQPLRVRPVQHVVQGAEHEVLHEEHVGGGQAVGQAAHHVGVHHLRARSGKSYVHQGWDRDLSARVS